MNVFGIGGPELIAILIIMLVFAGPKRMMHWSYILGQYVSKFRTMWSQTVDVIQKEFDDAGVDITLPKEMPTRGNLNKSINEAFKPISKPFEETMEEVQKDLDTVKEVSDELKPKPIKKMSVVSKKKPDSVPAQDSAAPALGTWGGGSESTSSKETASNGNRVDMGTWSSPPTDK